MTKTIIKLNEVTARDAHQSLLATRMRIDDIVQTAELNAGAGFNALEVWGGATFDVALRFLGENPWDNLRKIKTAMQKGAERAGVKPPRAMMLLRGQSVIGYKNYPDDVVRAFVRRAAENGMNIFRIFDGLNDTRNLAAAIEEVKACAADGMDVEAQGTICYTTGAIDPKAPKTATPLQKQLVFNLDYYLQKARELKALKCDTICLKDMAGLMEPDVAEELISAIQSETGLPVTLHMHAGMGMSDATIMRAIKVGVDVVDVGNAGLASGSGHSSAQMILDMMGRCDDPDITSRTPEINKDILKRLREFLLFIRPKYAPWEGPYNPEVQPKIWAAQIPGGMLSNFKSQIKQQIKGMDASFDDVLEQVLDEVPKVREDLGWPPLVTPCSQIVGVQAVLNVLGKIRGGERYDQMPEGTQKMLLGELGKTPVTPNETLVQKAEEATGRKRITSRPADHIKHGLPAAENMMRDNGLNPSDIEDVLITVLWDALGLSFLQNEDTPENIASYEAPPKFPVHMTIKSWIEGSIAFGDVHDAFGAHVIEAIAQTAKEIYRIEQGFFHYLPEGELEYRLEKYRGYIDRQIAQIPCRLQNKGFNQYQTEWALVNDRAQSFNKVMEERCLALGVPPEHVPQISTVGLGAHFKVAIDENCCVISGSACVPLSTTLKLKTA